MRQLPPVISRLSIIFIRAGGFLLMQSPTKKSFKMKYVKCYLTPDEKQIINDKAKSINISASRYMKLSALHKPLPNFANKELKAVLLKINADIARLGNLQRTVIDKNQQLPLDIIEQIRELKGMLKDKIREL